MQLAACWLKLSGAATSLHSQGAGNKRDRGNGKCSRAPGDYPPPTLKSEFGEAARALGQGQGLAGITAKENVPYFSIAVPLQDRSSLAWWTYFLLCQLGMVRPQPRWAMSRVPSSHWRWSQDRQTEV